MSKIMFNHRYGLNQAVIDGRKTMTRRLLPERAQLVLDKPLRFRAIIDNMLSVFPDDGTQQDFRLPYSINEVIPIAQSYQELGYTKEWVQKNIKPNPHSKPTDPFRKRFPGYTNKMFTKEEAMLNNIWITDAKIERLQDISEEDCMKEGILQYGDPFHEDRMEDFYFVGATKHYLTAKEAFADLINKVGGKGTWESNPYVVAYTFHLTALKPKR